MNVMFKRKKKSDFDLDADEIFSPLKKKCTLKKRFLKWGSLILLGLFLFSFIIPPFSMPAKGTITSGYSIRVKPDSSRWLDFETHSGLDIANTKGTPIFASKSGIVTQAGVSPGFGKHVIITHFPGVQTVYAHMDQLLVKKGQFVTRVTKIGLMGSTGRSTGNHLHFEVIIFGAKWPPGVWLFHDRLRERIF